jgi:DNA-binding NarL/FixJ family response regulator
MLVDISMPVLSGTEAVKRIRTIDPTAKALFLSMYDSEDYVYLCVKAGGLGLINKNSMEDELVNAIIKVYNGEKYFGTNYTEQKLIDLLIKFENINKQVKNIEISILTNREKQLLKLIGDGLTNLEIAGKMNISIRTIEAHRSNLIHKLGIKSLPELIKFAIEYNLKGQG